MRNPDDVFHLAIPTTDLDEAQDFYVGVLGCHLARRYHDRITLDFFGDQVVCHLWEEQPGELSLYPRHFGVTFRTREDFQRLHACARQRGAKFFTELAVRFEGLVEEHLYFVLVDPSGNLIEFKHYNDPRMMY